MGVKAYVVCVGIDDEHTDDAVRGKCAHCDKKVWVSPHNATDSLLCLSCFKEISKTGQVSIGAKKQDIIRARRELKKRGLL